MAVVGAEAEGVAEKRSSEAVPLKRSMGPLDTPELVTAAAGVEEAGLTGRREAAIRSISLTVSGAFWAKVRPISVAVISKTFMGKLCDDATMIRGAL